MQSNYTTNFEPTSNKTFIYSGCLRLGYKMVSQGHPAGPAYNMTECQSACKLDSRCHLFEWDHRRKMCKFIKEPSYGKYHITQESNVLIGIPNCDNIEEHWLKMNYVEIADPADQTVPKSSDQKANNSIE
jgi:hypothetical protein